MNIALIGFGKYGQAIGSLLAHNQHEYEIAEVDQLLTKPADVAFAVTPTQHLRNAMAANSDFLTDKTLVINCSKGIEEGSHLLPHQIIRESGKYPNYGSMAGPTFAEEILARNPSVASLATNQPGQQKIIKNLLETDYFKLEPFKDCRALELTSALKNIYAILCGYSEGLGYGTNTRVAIILRAAGEFEHLAKAMGFDDSSVLSPGVIGDMMLTCSSRESRNYSYGLELAKKHDLNPHEGPVTTVEGYHNCHSIGALADEYHVKLPLASLAARLVSGKADASDFVKVLSD